jgi:hypothetical protein
VEENHLDKAKPFNLRIISLHPGIQEVPIRENIAITVIIHLINYYLQVVVLNRKVKLIIIILIIQ